MQKIQKNLKTIQIISNITLIAPICHQFWKETLKLTSGCPVYHNANGCDFMPSMNKSLFGKRLVNVCSVSVDDVPNGVS